MFVLLRKNGRLEGGGVRYDRLYGCKVESEWRHIWSETFSIKMSGACPPQPMNSLSIVYFLKTYLFVA